MYVFLIDFYSLIFFCFREVDVILTYLKEQCNTKKIGVVGFCWGGAAVHHLMLKYYEFKAGVSVYGMCQIPWSQWKQMPLHALQR